MELDWANVDKVGTDQMSENATKRRRLPLSVPIRALTGRFRHLMRCLDSEMIARERYGFPISPRNPCLVNLFWVSEFLTCGKAEPTRRFKPDRQLVD